MSSRFKVRGSRFNVKMIAFLAVIVALCVYVGFTSAASLAIGGIRLAGDMEISDERIDLTNGATLELSGSPWKCEICGKTIQDALITAKTISADLKKAEKKLLLTKATAATDVIIHARQVDKVKKTTRFIHASANKAVYTPATPGSEDEAIVLTGKATVKLIDPDLEEPATLTGDSVTVYLNKNKITVKSGDMTIKPKEGAPK